MTATSDTPTAPAATVAVAPWPSEAPLFVLVLLASLSIWAGLVLSIFGAVYALFIAIGIFLVHLLFVVHVRGSAVKLGPAAWEEEHGEPFPPDPFDGAPYGYRAEDDIERRR